MSTKNSPTATPYPLLSLVSRNHARNLFSADLHELQKINAQLERLAPHVATCFPAKLLQGQVRRALNQRGA